MALALRYAVRSDVGLLREGNEDSAYAGPHLLAIADGMGGYEAGEVASAAVIAAVAPLDQAETPETGLIDALAGAVATAKQKLRDIVLADPAVGSMGTTLTAMLWAGGTAAICHIGDSRAYLLRGDELYQITHDHTFVQALIDQGRIRPEEAAVHPQRSLILRALDGRGDAEPDLSVLTAETGDRYLLCSDGLPVAASDDEILAVLADAHGPQDAVAQLVELAIRGGGPDNITCIVADVIDTAESHLAASAAPLLAGAASAAASHDTRPFARPTGLHRNRSGSRAATAVAVAEQTAAPEDGGAAQAEDIAPSPARRRWPVMTTMLVVLVLVIAGALFAAYQYTQSQYYVGAKQGEVVIFRGINSSVLGISLSSPQTRTGIAIGSVPLNMVQGVRDTTSPGSLAAAQRIVGNIRRGIAACKSEYAALARWQAAAKPVKKTVIRHGRKVTITVVPKVGPKPVVQSSCPPAADL